MRLPGQEGHRKMALSDKSSSGFVPWKGGPPSCKVMLGNTLQQAAQNRAKADNARKVRDTLSQE